MCIHEYIIIIIVIGVGKTTSYVAVILAGVGILGAIGYALYSEIFSSTGPISIYDAAADKVKAHPEVFFLHYIRIHYSFQLAIFIFFLKHLNNSN